MRFGWLKKLLCRDKSRQIDPDMKYLIVGLGNIGTEYVATRHNIGFEAIDYFVEQHRCREETLRYGEMHVCKYRGKQLFLLKPNTFMNLSGKAVKYWMDKEKIKPDHLLIVVDDLQLDLGVIRLRAKGAAGGHNGLQNIQDRLGTSKYPRLRIGIGKDFPKGGQVDFVLGKWTDKELDQLPAILQKTSECIESFVFRGLQNTMQAFNG